METRWRELIGTLTSDAVFAPGVDDGSIAAAEESLHQKFPSLLASLLRESNGVKGEYGLRLVWSIERIVADNLNFRTNREFAEIYMPFDDLLFFADAGNGDQFAIVQRAEREKVYGWNHENDSRAWVAPDLEIYLRWWLEGEIKF